ncbi:MAG: cupin domain-containing protein [Gammaproteobacteria bacterium]|nr:cupin domain-containing protein [Gammaproteobacteria bacterium]
MKTISKKFLTLVLIVTNLIFTSALASSEQSSAVYNFNTMPAYQLIDTINMRFVTSDSFTIIQWNMKAGAKLMPQHKHPNEQVIRVLEGMLQVHSGLSITTLRKGDVMIFASNVPHGFIAVTDTVMYEQQTPFRKDFLEEGFIQKLSAILKQNQ